jgi:CBS domain containing-hemolysin-like protein
MERRLATRRNCRWPSRIASLTACLLPGAAQASFLQGETLDSVAMGLAWFIVVVMPVVGIVVFWKLHILPEKIAEKRNHPQAAAIKTLCLLSLVFGGILWPLAWLLAYTKPVLYKMAYGTDKGEHGGHQEPDVALAPDGGTSTELRELRAELQSMKLRLEQINCSSGAAGTEGKGAA